MIKTALLIIILHQSSDSFRIIIMSIELTTIVIMVINILISPITIW